VRSQLRDGSRRIRVKGELAKRCGDAAVQPAAALPHEGQSLIAAIDELPAQRHRVADDVKRRLGNREPQLDLRRVAKRRSHGKRQQENSQPVTCRFF